MAELDPKQARKLEQAQRSANEAIKDGTDLTRTLGTLLDKQIKSASNYNKIIKNRTRVLNDIGKSEKGSVSNIRSAFTNQVNILRTQNQIAKARSKTGQFQKGYNNSVVEGLNTDLKALKAQKEKISFQAIQKEATAGINKGFAIGLGIFTSLVAIAVKFANKLDTIGDQFGSLNVLGGDFQNTLIEQGNSVTALGFGVQDVASVTNTLASNFGMNVDEASKLSGKVLDTGKALGLSSDEASNLFGVLMSIGGLTAKQTEELTEGAFQLARQAGVAPQQVLKDIAGSAETVAIFTKDGGKNLLEAAVAARQLGISIDDVAKSARGVLNFEESITKELETSVLTGAQLDLNRARQLSLSKDIAGFEREIRRQIEQQGDFASMNVFQQEALADAFNMSVEQVSRISKGLEDVSIKGALASNNFEDLVGRDSMSNISSLIGSFKQLAAILTDALGKGLEDSVGGIKDFLGNQDNVNALKESFTEIGQKLGGMVTAFTEFLKNSGGLTAIAAGAKAFATGISSAVSLLPTLIAGMVALKTASLALSLAQIFPALLGSAGKGGAFGVVATVAAIAAGYTALRALTPKAQTGITGFGGGDLMVGESGPEILQNVPRGANVISAEPTRQLLNAEQPQPIIAPDFGMKDAFENSFSILTGEVKKLVGLQQINNEGQRNFELSADRGVIRVAMEPQYGGDPL